MEQAVKKSDLIINRQAVLNDKNFILATWLRGLYYGRSYLSEVPKNIFMNKYKIVLECLLNTSKIKIACLKDDPEVILGYAIVSIDNKALHWVFVKKAWRKIGIAKSLVPDTISVVTHLTEMGLSIKKKYSGIIFNPFLL